MTIAVSGEAEFERLAMNARRTPQPHAAKLKKGGRRNRIPAPHAYEGPDLRFAWRVCRH
jgi:hypothetical protein